MKILIWTGQHDILRSAIEFITHGKGGHAAFLRNDNKTVHEVFWPRVRDRKLTPRDLRNTEIYEIEGVTKKQTREFEKLFDRNIEAGIKYSIIDLFRFALNIPTKSEKHTFCSKYILTCCSKILTEEQMPLVRLKYKNWASPRDLRISPKLKPCVLEPDTQ